MTIPKPSFVLEHVFVFTTINVNAPNVLSVRIFGSYGILLLVDSDWYIFADSSKNRSMSIFNFKQSETLYVK